MSDTTGIRHTCTSPALSRGPYAKRYLPWPPEGFEEPARPELLDALRHRNWIYLKKIETERIIRWIQVLGWFGPEISRGRDPYPEISRTAGKNIESEVIDFLHVLRRELRKRPDRSPADSLRINRCGMCSHGSERLWEATGETHSLIDRNDEPIDGIMLCARCWSDYLITEE